MLSDIRFRFICGFSDLQLTRVWNIEEGGGGERGMRLPIECE